MKVVGDVVNSFLRFFGIQDETPPTRKCCKRNRVYDDFSSDDETPVLGYQQMKRSRLADIRTTNDDINKDQCSSKKKPEAIKFHFNITTPKGTIPMDMPGLSGYKPVISARRSRPGILSTNYEVDVDQEESNATWKESKSKKSRNKTILHLDLDDNDSQSDDDVIFVKKITTSTTPSELPAKINLTVDDEHNNNYHMRKEKVIDTPGITESYKKITNLQKLKRDLDSKLLHSKSEIEKVRDKANDTVSDITLNGNNKQSVINSNEDNSFKPDTVGEWLAKLDAKYFPTSQKTAERIKHAREDHVSIEDSIQNTSPINFDTAENLKAKLKSKTQYQESGGKHKNNREDCRSKPLEAANEELTVNSEQFVVKMDSFEDLITKLESKYKADREMTHEKPNNDRLQENRAQKETRTYKPATWKNWILNSDSYSADPKTKETHNDAFSKKISTVDNWLSQRKSRQKTTFQETKDATKLNSEQYKFSSNQSTSIGNGRLTNLDYQNKTKQANTRIKYNNERKSKVNAKVNNSIQNKFSSSDNWLSRLGLDSRHKTSSQTSQDTKFLSKVDSIKVDEKSNKLNVSKNWITKLGLGSEYKSKTTAEKGQEILRNVREDKKIESKVNSHEIDAFSDSIKTSGDKLTKLKSKKKDQFKTKIQLDDNSYKDAIQSLEIGTSLYNKYVQKTEENNNIVCLGSDVLTQKNNEDRPSKEDSAKHELYKSKSIIVEILPNCDLPDLTPEQEESVDKALEPEPKDEILIDKFNLKIHRRDLNTLSSQEWLNDEVINFYMNLIMQRSEERKDLPKVYATNTFFYPKLMQSGQAGLRRWTRKVDIFAYDLFLVPVNIDSHWCLSIVDFRERKIQYLDSRRHDNQDCLEALLQYLKDEHQDKKGAPFDDSGWKTEFLDDIPEQTNTGDCGMFACTFAEFSSRNAPYTFTQAHMPYLRRKAALEILMGKLMLQASLCVRY